MSRKDTLLEELNANRAEWDELLAQVGENELLVPGVSGDWTIKDIIAHLTFWENRTVKWFEAAQRGTTPDPSGMPKDLTEDEENAWIYERNRERTLQDVLAESRQVHDALLSHVTNLSEEELFEIKYEWLGNNSLAEALPGNSYEHYHIHAATVREWLGARQG